MKHTALDIFTQLLELELSDADLAAILSKRYPDIDASLKCQVNNLITAHIANKQHTLFKQAISQPTDLLKDNSQSHQLIGKSISTFTLDMVVGEGGMGVVYKASRNDNKLSQKVAIKIISPVIASLHGEAELMQEAQFLAQLSHPYIANVIDVGECEYGTYIIMEYIEGKTLISYCQSNDLNISARLALFNKICDAVNFAHQNRIIHADLKPSNILVTPTHNPKLVDFGISRTTYTDDKHESYNAYIKALSHEFASPEQLQGDPLTTQSDVYSLGKILKNLIDTAANAELCAIIEKATATKPESRFSSVMAFKESIITYSAHKPLTWYNSSTSYIIKKYCQRAPITASLVVLAFGLSAFTLSGIYLFQAQKIKAATTQKQVLDFYEALLLNRVPNTPQGDQLSAAALLNSGVELTKLHPLNKENKTQILLTLANSLYIHGNYQAALTHLNKLAPSPEYYQLKISCLLKLNNTNQAREAWQTYNAEFPKSNKIRLLKWLTQHVFDYAETAHIKDYLERKTSLPLTKHLFLNRHKNNHLTPWLLSHIKKLNSDEQQPYADIAWLMLIQGVLELELTLKQSNFVELALAQANETYHALHPELAALHMQAAKYFAKNNNKLEQEQSLNRAMNIYKQLSPQFDHAYLLILWAQFEYYQRHNDAYQAQSYLNLLLEKCPIRGPLCEKGKFESALIALELRQFKKAFVLSRSWLQNNKNAGSEFIDMQLTHYEAQFHLGDFSVNNIKFSIQHLSEFTPEQLNAWIKLSVVSQAFISLNENTHTFLNQQAVENALIARALLNAWAAYPIKTNNQIKPQLTLLSAKTHQQDEHLLPADSGILIKTRRTNAVIQPTHANILNIGEKFTVTWDKTKLPGDNISILINHSRHFAVDSFDDFESIKQVDWKLAVAKLENTGQYHLDPYFLMANGEESFKLMLVSNLGYWGLSNGLFSVRSGNVIDNGLEHLLTQDKLSSAITAPKALDVYHIGQKKHIIWDPIKLSGERIAMYVLHDSPKGIGNRLEVDLTTLKNRRWYLAIQNIPNSGELLIDPALFNGRGNNYKLLLVSDQGYWSVSDKRFSVVNPL